MCQIINVTYSGDSRVENKEDGKVDEYGDVAMEMKALCKMKIVNIVTVVIRFPGTIPN